MCTSVVIICLVIITHKVYSRPANMVLDLNRGIVTGRHSYIKVLNSPNPSTIVPCSSQALLRLDFSGPYKKAKFELFYGEEPHLWTFLAADSPKAYGFGGNHKYTSNCASAQVFNKQLRIYSNVLADYRYHTMDGHTLMDVEDDAVAKGSNLTVEIGDETIAWRAKRPPYISSFINSFSRSYPDKDRLRSPFLFALSGQKAEFGPSDYYVYAAFNRVPLGTFHNGSGLCRVKVTFKRGKQENGLCGMVSHLCHRHAFCKQTHQSFKCICKSGYHGDGQKSCRDVNECNNHNGGCSQICHNTLGSYYCGCRHGYMLLPNGRTCSGKKTDISTKRIRLRFHVGDCSLALQNARSLFKELKRKLIHQEICVQPCEIHSFSTKCRGKKKLLLAFKLVLDQGVVSTSKLCNNSCLRCEIEKRLHKFISDFRTLALDKKFNVSLRGKLYSMNLRSLKIPGVRSACKQGRRLKRKRLAGCMPGRYFDIFLQRCVSCSRGTYQPNRSETFCLRCPANKTTLYSGSSEIHQCQNTRCGGNLTSMSGIITSPNYPDAYPRDVECTWSIYPSEGRNILLLIPKISLPTSHACSDYLSMREGESPYSVVTYYACESFDQPVAFVSRSKNLHIKFRSGGDGMAEGFKIFYVTFEEKYLGLVRVIVESGEMYANESNRRLLQDEKLVREILDVIVQPKRLHQIYPNVSHVDSKVPKSFRIFIEGKVEDYFSAPFLRKRRSVRDKGRSVRDKIDM